MQIIVRNLGTNNKEQALMGNVTPLYNIQYSCVVQAW